MAKLSSTEKSAASLAKKTIIQILFATGGTYTVDGLREKLRSFFKDAVPAEERAAAAFGNDELLDILLEANRELAPLGLHLRVVNGAVSFITTKVHPKASAFLATKFPAPGGLKPSLLEVLAVIAEKQPITQAEINYIFDSDRRDAVYALREARLVEVFCESGERNRYATTDEFLSRFRLKDIQEYRSLLAKLLNGHSSSEEMIT